MIGKFKLLIPGHLQGNSKCSGFTNCLGFTYIGLLILIAVASIALAGVGIVWHQDTQREKEKDLLFIGEEFRQAIGSYYENSPNGEKSYPKNLADLIKDNRFPSVKRHLRKLYADPLAISKPWGLVQQGGNIMGVFSTSTQKPIKKFGFPKLYETFGTAEAYNEWLFVYSSGADNAPVSNPENQNLGL